MNLNDSTVIELLECFIINANDEQLKQFYLNKAMEADCTEFENIIYGTYHCNISREKINNIIKVIEEEYLKNNYDYLITSLAILYNKVENEALCKYYLNLLESNKANPLIYEDKILDLLEKIKNNNSRELPNLTNIWVSEHKGSFNYIYMNEKKSYSVISYSKEIGNNMTILKTEYGSIIFDCGAKVNEYGCYHISTSDFMDFLEHNDIEISDIKALLISHAHLDHYGSLMDIINAGISPEIIFINRYTKKLIEEVTLDIPNFPLIKPISEFKSDEFTIKAFENGHILGSEGYVITFDNINVFYTGDFSLHDQPIVSGMNIESIKNYKPIQELGLACLITESTYGLKDKSLSYNDAAEILKHFIDILLELGYKIFIPSFAIGRTQEIAMLINEEKYRIKIDGLAAKISFVYENLLKNVKIYNSNIKYINSQQMKLNAYAHTDIILSSSGMISENSTSANYIKEILESDKKIAIIKTGYINSESYGEYVLNKLIDNNNIVLDIPLSAHASKEDIFKLISELSPKNVVAIHGNGLGIVNETEEILPEINNKELSHIENDITINEAIDSNEKTEISIDNAVYEVEEEFLSSLIKDIIEKGEIYLEHGDNLNDYSSMYKKIIRYLKANPKYKRAVEICLGFGEDYYKIHCYIRDYFK